MDVCQHYNFCFEGLSTCTLHPKNATITEYGQRLSLTFTVPCNVTEVHWITSGPDEDLFNKLVENRDGLDHEAQISFDIRSFQCIDESKKAYFAVNITDKVHLLLNGIVAAIGYTENSSAFECISIPFHRYTVINKTGM